MTPHELSLLHDMREAASDILTRTQGCDKEGFVNKRDLQLIVERLFITLGEAAVRLEKQYPQTASRVPNLRGPIGFRNFLIHVYDQIDPARVWDVVVSDLATLSDAVSRLLTDAAGTEEA